MSTKRVGWCRIKEELVLDQNILMIPYLQDDMDVYYQTKQGYWSRWTPETQHFAAIRQEEVPEMIQLAMVMLS